MCVSTRRPGPGEQNPPREYWCAVSAAGGGGGRSRMRAGKKGGEGAGRVTKGALYSNKVRI